MVNIDDYHENGGRIMAENLSVAELFSGLGILYSFGILFKIPF